MAIIDVDDLIGCAFQALDNQGNTHQKTILDVIKEHEYSINNDPQHIKFRVSRNQDQYEEIMSYNDVMAAEF